MKLSVLTLSQKNTLGGGAITQGGAEGMAGTTGILRGWCYLWFLSSTFFVFTAILEKIPIFYEQVSTRWVLYKTTKLDEDICRKLPAKANHTIGTTRTPTCPYRPGSVAATRPKRRSSARRSTNCRMVWGAGWSNFQSHSKR